METQAAYAFVLSLFLSMALIPPLVRIANRLGFTDKGGGRKVHEGVIPRIGGVAIYIGFLVPVLLWVPLRQDIHSFVVASAVVFAFGVLDDRFNLDYRIKLLGQALAVLIVTLYGGILIQRVPFLPDGILPNMLALPFTILVLVGVTNAVNLSDGLDGLAGGISLLAVGCLVLLAWYGGDGAVVILGLSVIGALFGFLRFNTFPARLFMGDTGSQFLGFSVGVLSVIVTQHSNPALSPVLPLLIIGLPILDTLKVMIGRIARGCSPFAADRTHLHHRLLASGLNQYEAVSLVYATQLLLVVCAYFLRYSFDGVILLTYGVFCIVVLLVVKRLERYHGHLRARKEHKITLLRLITRLREMRTFVQGPLLVLSTSIPLFLTFGAVVASPVSGDIGLLAMALAVTLLLAIFIRPMPFFFLERLAAYSAAATVTYLVAQSEWLMEACGICIHGFFAFLALTTAIWVRFSSTYFRVSTLDVLILLTALTIPSLQGLGLKHLGIVVLESIILFYGIEVVMQERGRTWDLLRIGILASLTVLALKGLLA